MSDNYNDGPVWHVNSQQAAFRDIDQGLRSYMVSVYNFMALGLGLTGLVAYGMSSSPEIMRAIFGTPLFWVAMLAPFGLVMYISVRINTLSFSKAQTLFWIYSALMGVSLSSIFLIYTGESIARLFFITASIFASMSLYGYTTKRDLTSFGSFLTMGLVGIIIASVVNLFLHSSAMQLMISCIGVLVFTGLTAYDTQKIKEIYSANDTAETSGKKALFGALQLYLDFVNLFIMLLQIFGNRR
jgi:FtsH-binding integral membrane protein